MKLKNIKKLFMSKDERYRRYVASWDWFCLLWNRAPYMFEEMDEVVEC